MRSKIYKEMQIEVESNYRNDDAAGLVFPGDKITDQDVYMK
jgi:hypothetical protein